MKTNLELYEQTQEMAMIIAAGNGFIPVKENDFSIFTHLSRNARISGFFATAVAIQESINQHEMYDVLDECEEIILAKYHGEASAYALDIKIAKCHIAALVINKATDSIKKQEAFIADAIRN